MEGCDNMREGPSSSSSSSSKNDIGVAGGWQLTYSMAAVLIILVWRLLKITSRRFSYYLKPQITTPSNLRHSINTSESSSSLPQPGISCLISDSDLKTLMDNLDESLNGETVKWENVIHKSSNDMSYSAKCCKPKDGPLQYMSVTVFEDCSALLLKDFYMDNNYRKQWDNTLIEQNLLQVDESSGVEIGRLIKKFPLLKPREYVLAWRLWKTGEDTYYCFSKECDHPLAPRQKKYVRVGFLRSGWMIRKVPGRNACEIRMLHQEDAGLNPDMAKFAFASGIWRYMSKMNNALRKYIAINNLHMNSTVDFVQEAPATVCTLDISNTTARRKMSTKSSVIQQVTQEHNSRSSRRPSSKLITNGLILLGGVICLSRGHPNLGAKVAVSYILTKLKKRGQLSQKACFSTAKSLN